MTIPMARSLLAEMDAVDGHRELGNGILDIALALTGQKPREKQKPREAAAPPPRAAEPEPAGILLPELRAVVEAQMRTEGWQPPSQPPRSDVSSPE